MSSSSSVSRWAGDLMGKCFRGEAQPGLSRGGAGFRPRAPTLRWCRMSPWGPTAPGESWCSFCLSSGRSHVDGQEAHAEPGLSRSPVTLALHLPGTRYLPELPVSPPPRGCTLIMAGVVKVHRVTGSQMLHSCLGTRNEEVWATF